LCHEMVHVRLVAAGGAVGEDHGPEFQTQLRRLLDEGAFEGAFATDAEKAAMKASLATEVAWLDAESAAVREAGAALGHDREEIDRLVEDLNARITKANAEQTGWPSDDEQKSVKDRLAGINTRSEAHNIRVAEFNRRIDAYNQAVERYNLVVSYPDGLAATRIEPRTSFKSGGQ
jgi:chromosome segregation ATPase